MTTKDALSVLGYLASHECYEFPQDPFDIATLIEYLESLDLDYEFVMRVLKRDYDTFYFFNEEMFKDGDYDYIQIDIDAGYARVGIFTEVAGNIAWLDEWKKEWFIGLNRDGEIEYEFKDDEYVLSQPLESFEVAEEKPDLTCYFRELLEKTFDSIWERLPTEKSKIGDKLPIEKIKFTALADYTTRHKSGGIVMTITTKFDIGDYAYMIDAGSVCIHSPVPPILKCKVEKLLIKDDGVIYLLKFKTKEAEKRFELNERYLFASEKDAKEYIVNHITVVGER